MKGMAESNWIVTAVEICGKAGRGYEKRQQSCRTPHELGENICVEKIVAEFAFGVEFLG